MNQHNVVFRSKRERERESDLLSNYREIGIAAIAAASAACRKNKAKAKAPLVANGNARD